MKSGSSCCTVRTSSTRPCCSRCFMKCRAVSSALGSSSRVLVSACHKAYAHVSGAVNNGRLENTVCQVFATHVVYKTKGNAQFSKSP